MPTSENQMGHNMCLSYACYLRTKKIWTDFTLHTSPQRKLKPEFYSMDIVYKLLKTTTNRILQ